MKKISRFNWFCYFSSMPLFPARPVRGTGSLFWKGGGRQDVSLPPSRGRGGRGGVIDDKVTSSRLPVFFLFASKSVCENIRFTFVKIQIFIRSKESWRSQSCLNYRMNSALTSIAVELNILRLSLFFLLPTFHIPVNSRMQHNIQVRSKSSRLIFTQKLKESVVTPRR
jgi:hypothetical protein